MLHGTGIVTFMIHECHKFKPNEVNIPFMEAFGMVIIFLNFGAVGGAVSGFVFYF